MTRTWKDNAHEFGALVKQGKDVRLALLVACSVQKGRGGPRTAANAAVLKGSAREFAETAGLAKDGTRVLRHFDAWEQMAKAGHVPAASTLKPADAETFGEVSDEVQAAFEEVFTSITDDKPTGGRPRDSRPEDAVKIIGKRGAKPVLDAMEKDEFDALAKAVSKKRAENFEADFAKKRKRKPKVKDHANDGGGDKELLAQQATRLALFGQTEPSVGAMTEIASILSGPQRTHLDAEILDEYLPQWLDSMRMALDMVERSLKGVTAGEALADQIEDFLSDQQ